MFYNVNISRKILPILLIIFVMAFSNSRAEWIKLNNGSKEIETTVISSSPSSTVIEFTINGFEYEDITLNGEFYSHVSLSGSIPMMVKGYPMLPNIRKSILIPDMAGMNYKIISSEKTTVDVSTLIPSKGHLTRNIDPADVPLTFSELYTSDTWFPENIVELDEPYIVRDLRGQTIEYHPFRYNATRGKLEVTTKIRIEVFEDASVQAVNPFIRTNSFEGVSREFEGVYNTLFVNYGQGNIEYTPIPEPGRLLIIYYQDYADEIIPYYEWKLAKGMPTVKAEYPTETGSGSGAIKTYIQNMFDEPEGLTYIVLVGESDEIPTLYGQYEGAASDPSYVKLAGNDAYPDAYISRISPESETNLEYVLYKLKKYETAPPATNMWFMRGTGVASNEGDPPDYERAGWLRDMLMNDFDFLEVDEIYAPGASASQVTSALNEGRSILNYLGHGTGTSWSTTGFDVSDVHQLSNGYMNPFFIDVACQNGDFERPECFEEAWLRAGSMADPKGAIAAYGSSTNASWTPPCDMQNHGMELLTQRERNTVGGVCFNGVMHAMDLWGGSSGEGLKLMEQYNIFGDCSTVMTFGMIPDSTAPESIADLDAGNPTSSSITLTWTAPLDTSFGGVISYDIRYSTEMLTNDNFSSAEGVIFAGNPDSAGTPKSYEFKELNFGTNYYFAAKAIDMWGNTSDISNIAEGATLAAPEISVSPDAVNKALQPGMQVFETVNIANVSQENSSLDYSIELTNHNFPGEFKLKVVPKPVISATEAGTKENQAERNGVALRGIGGPDEFGYEWIDSDEDNGPDYEWNDISSTGTLASEWTPTGTYDPKDEGYAGPFDIGFDFKYYGEMKTQVYLGSNGFITFDSFSGNTWENGTLPSADDLNDMIAIFWDDLDGKDDGTVHYKQDGNKFIVQYTNWHKYWGSGALTFQVVFYSSGKILVYYNTVTLDNEGCTTGIENMDGTIGLTVANNAPYAKNELALMFSDEPEWLSANNLEGTIFSGNSVDVILEFTTDDLDEGLYSMDLEITNSDPNNSLVVVPVQMTIGEVSLGWTCDITVADNGGIEAGTMLSFGASPMGTDGIDADLGEYELPPAPPAGVFDARFELPATIASPVDIRNNELDEIDWTMKVQPGASGYPFTLTWDPASLPDGSVMMKDPFTGTLVNVNMKEQSSYTLENQSINSLVIEYREMMMVSMNTNSGWNMISVPVFADDMSVTHMFPDATSQAFMFDNGYTTVNTLDNGTGYWLKFDAVQSHQMMGMPVTGNVAVNENWNMIGFFDQVVPVDQITSNPAGIITSVIYGFNNTYSIVDQLEPGHGYWIKCSEPGELIYTPVAKTNPEEKSEENWASITVTDALGNRGQLFIADNSSSFYELPPAPPAGVFDLRYASGRFVENISAGTEIVMNSVTFPVTISAEGTDLVISDPAGGDIFNVSLKDGESTQITDSRFSRLVIASTDIPDEFALDQNYPNPFNPSTNISFALPLDSKVSVKIYNVLGQVVTELVDGNFSAGMHKIKFNASKLASGIYFYNITADATDGSSFSETKKMMLMK